MRISDWSSDVCSSDLRVAGLARGAEGERLGGAEPRAVTIELAEDGTGLLDHLVAGRDGAARGGVVASDGADEIIEPGHTPPDQARLCCDRAEMLGGWIGASDVEARGLAAEI